MDKLLTVCEMVEKKLNDEHIYASVWPYRSDMPVMDVEIQWGDWKHDHARAKWLLGEISGIHYISSAVTEENGSDCYSAVHHFYVEGDEAIGALNCA